MQIFLAYSDIIFKCFRSYPIEFRKVWSRTRSLLSMFFRYFSLQDSIRKTSLNGDSPGVVVNGLNSPAGLALDIASGTLYYVESNKIAVVDLSSGTQTDLLTNLGKPKGVALHLAAEFPGGGKMYRTSPDGFENCTY